MVVNRKETLVLALGDFCILLISLWLALIVRKLTLPSLGFFWVNATSFIPLFALSLAIFYVAGLYEKQTRPILRIMGTRILGAQITTVILGAAYFFLMPLSVEPKTILVLYLIISVLAESAWRMFRLRAVPPVSLGKKALLVGRGQAVFDLFEELKENPRHLLNVIDVISPREHVGDLADRVTEGIKRGASILVVDTSDSVVSTALAHLYESLKENVRVIDFATLYEELFDRVPLEHLDPIRLAEAVPTRRTMYDTGKRLFDVVVALAGSVVALPVLGLAAVILLLSGRAPFIRPERIGQGGRTIRLYKLCTMLFDDKGDPELHKKNRITPFGKFLRKTRIDELPQLLNVLTGDLSFIGPRPEIPSIVEVYEREIPYYRMRHAIIPGLSGWAQIHDYDAPRGPADIVRTRRKLSFDLYYLKHRSVGLDLAIALKSVRALLAFSGT